MKGQTSPEIYRLLKIHEEDIKSYIDQGQITSWAQMSRKIEERSGSNIPAQNLRQKWESMVADYYAKKKSEWDPQQIQFMMTITEKYGPDIRILGQTIWTKRTGIAIRNCLKNQFEKAIRYIEQVLESQFKVSIVQLENADLLKLGAILVNNNHPSQVSQKVTALRNKISQVWRKISSKDSKITKQEVTCIQQELQNFKQSLLKPPQTQSRKKGPPKRTKEEIHAAKVKRQQDRKRKRQEQQQKRKMKKQDQEREKAMRVEQREKKKLAEQIRKRRQRQQSLLSLQKSLERNVNKVVSNQTVFEDD